MPKVSGVFDEFKDLDKIPVEDVSKWLNPAPNPITLQNFISNRIYYPQSVPSTQEELNFDLAILREALVRNLKFLNKNSKKVTLPQWFLFRFPDTLGLVVAFIDAYIYSQSDNPYGLWTFNVKLDTKELKLATVVVPQFEDVAGVFKFTINNKRFTVKAGEFLNTRCNENKCKLTYQVSMGTFLGNKEGMIEVNSGQAGVLIDGRRYG